VVVVLVLVVLVVQQHPCKLLAATVLAVAAVAVESKLYQGVDRGLRSVLAAWQ
jgi:hypothetical protein